MKKCFIAINLVVLTILSACNKSEPYYDAKGLLMRESWRIQTTTGVFEELNTERTIPTMQFYTADSMRYYYITTGDTIFKKGTWSLSADKLQLQLNIEDASFGEQDLGVKQLDLNNLSLENTSGSIYYTNLEGL